ncbi:MAG TPA: hypothetical protein VN737_10840 [Bryobacteraceae bacterium]|nr:hypothetical protein [Bryobacteraceae bacterium]
MFRKRGPHNPVCFLQRHYAVLLILAIAFLNVAPILWKGVVQGKDLDPHLSYFRAFLSELGPNDLYPRWLSTLNGGQGSPIFLIQYPLPYFFLLAVYWPIHFLTRMDVASAAPALVTATLFILIASSGWAAYEWLKSWCSPTAALFGSLVYAFAPYHFGVDAYERYALGELVAYSLIPLILLHTRNLMSGRKSRTYFVAISFLFAALVCSHPITAAMLLPLIVVQAMLVRPVSPGSRTRLGGLGFALGAGILLSSFYLFPFAADYRNVEMHPNPRLNHIYDDNYLKVPTSSVISAMQRHGASASAEKTVVRALRLFEPGFVRESKYVGFAAIESLIGDALMVLAGAVCVLMTNRWWRDTNLTVWLAIGIISIYVQTYPSHWIADVLPPLKTIQFPWRFSTITCVALAAVSAGCWERVRAQRRSRFRLAGLTAAVLVLLGSGNLVALSISSFRRHAIVTGVDVDQYYSYTGHAFQPVGDSQQPLALVRSRRLPASRHWNVIRNPVGGFVVHTNPTTTDTVVMNLICFPGWKAIDLKTGKPLVIGCDNTRGLATIALPNGTTDIKMFFALKISDYVGRWVSFVLAIGLLVYAMTSEEWKNLRRLHEYEQSGSRSGN